MFLRSASLATFGLFGGYFADRTTRHLFPFGLLIVALTMSATGLAPSYAVLMLLVLMSTIGLALFGPEATATAVHLGGSLRGLGLSIFLTGGPLGASLGPVVIASLVSAAGLQRTWVMVLPGLLLSVVLYRAFDALGQAPGATERSVDTRISIGVGPVLALACMVVLRSATEMGILTFLPLLIDERGGSLIAIGVTVGLLKMGSAAGTLIAGFLSDRTGWKHVTILSLVLAGALSWSFVRADGLLALIFVALLGAALRVSFPYTLLMAQRLLPERESTASALVFTLSLLGGGLGAFSSGFLADGLGVEVAMLGIGVSLPLAAALATMGVRDLQH